MRDWNELLPDLLRLICDCTSSFEDFVAFGRVCATWRSVALDLNLGKPLVPIPCLMLPQTDDNSNVRYFYNLNDGQTYGFNLPQLKGKFCMESKGWILTVSKEGDMSLLHPHKYEEIPLPHQKTSMCFEEHPMDPQIFVSRAVLSSPPYSEDCVVAIIHGGVGHLGFCRPGDKEWTVIGDKNNGNNAFQSLGYYRGKCYAVKNGGQVWECSVEGGGCNDDTTPPPTISARLIDGLNFDMSFKQSYLVESKGSLLAVIRSGAQSDNSTGDFTCTTEFTVFEIDVEQGVVSEVKSLGDRSIFVGLNGSLSVDTRLYPGLVPNSIYFTDDNDGAHEWGCPGWGKDVGIYNLGDKTIKPHYTGNSKSPVCPSIFVFLNCRQIL